jgi:hypothetical protein
VSHENLELAKRFYPGTFDIAERIDRPEFRERFATLVTPDFETVGAAAATELDTLDAHHPDDLTRRAAHGVAGFIETWRSFLDAWQSWVITATDFIEVDGDRVLVLIEIRGRSRTHGVEIPIEAANLLTLRDGRVARLELFTTRPPAYEAAGLPSPE